MEVEDFIKIRCSLFNNMIKFNLKIISHTTSIWQFSFGVLPPRPEEDRALAEPCLEICPNATRRKEIKRNMDKKEMAQCPKA